MKFGQRILDFVSYAYFGFDLSFCAFFEVKSSLFNTLEQNHDHYEMKLWCFKKIVSFSLLHSMCVFARRFSVFLNSVR